MATTKRKPAPAPAPTTPSGTVQIGVRVPIELLTALDAKVSELASERPGARVNRSDAIRELLYRALAPAAKAAK